MHKKLYILCTIFPLICISICYICIVAFKTSIIGSKKEKKIKILTGIETCLVSWVAGGGCPPCFHYPVDQQRRRKAALCLDSLYIIPTYIIESPNGETHKLEVFRTATGFSVYVDGSNICESITEEDFLQELENPTF